MAEPAYDDEARMVRAREIARKAEDKLWRDASLNGEQGERIDVKVGGQEFSAKVSSLNTVATVATLMLVSALAYATWVHASETRDASKELVAALREMAMVQRESNCLNALAQERRVENAEMCKRMAR